MAKNCAMPYAPAPKPAGKKPSFKKKPEVHGPAKNNAPPGDSRKGRLKDVKTDRGTFRFKANRAGD